MSADLFLGGPFNIASYASLLNIFSSLLGMLPNKMSISVGDAHVYNNHEEQFNIQAQQPQHDSPIFCSIDIRKHPDLRGLTVANYRIVGYECGPVIRADVAI